MTYFIVIVEGIIHNENKILIGRKRPGLPHPLSGKWHFPGGKLKSKENPYDAIIREIKEETSLDITPIKIVDTFTHVQSYSLNRKTPQNILHIIFECIPYGHCKIKPASDIIAVKWVETKNIKKFIFQYKTIERIKVKNLLAYLASNT